MLEERIPREVKKREHVGRRERDTGECDETRDTDKRKNEERPGEEGERKVGRMKGIEGRGKMKERVG